MSNRNFNASMITQRLANKAVAKNVLSNMKNENPYFFQQQSSNFNTSVINQVKLGNSMFASKGATCTTIDPGCPCPITRGITITGTTSLPNILGETGWATYLRSFGNINTTQNRGNSIAFDSLNNIYVVGSYETGFNPTSNTINVQNVDGNTQQASVITLPSSTGNSINMFLIKYNPEGIAQWATVFTGSSTDSGLSIAIDSEDGIYISGFHFMLNKTPLSNASGNTVAPFQVNSPITLPATTSQAAFLMKYNTSGIAQWATYLQGTGADKANSIAIDSNNNVYIAGTYNSSTDITIQNALLNVLSINDPSQQASNITLPATSSADWAFLIKYSKTGQAQWATYLNGSGITLGNSVAVDSANNVYITGQYRNFLSPGPIPTLFIKNANGNTVAPFQTNSNIILPNTTVSTETYMYLIKYNTDGTAQWGTYLFGSNANSLFTVGNSVIVDLNNNLYITGKYFTNIQINVQNATGNTVAPFQQASNITLPSTSNTERPFLIKYTANGTAEWATYLHASNLGIGNSLALDSYNNVYITGSYSYTGVTPLQVVNANGNTVVPFQQDSPITLPNTLSLDMYLIKYSPTGEAQLATYLQGTGSDSGNFVAINQLNNLYITGNYSSSTNVTIINANGNTAPPFQIASSVTILNTINTIRDAMFLIKYN